MKCRDFGRLRDETLDAREEMPPGLDPDFEAHAAVCPSCRTAAAGYQLLAQAMASLPPPPPASDESMARLRALRVPDARPSMVRRHRTALTRLASAASILAMAWLGFAASRGPARPGAGPLVVATPTALVAHPSPRTRPLEAALADATSATLDLALAASAPAARIGREALALQGTGPPPAGVGDGPDTPEAGAARLLEGFGERVNARVRPISGSARHAFSFLLGPVSGAPPAATAPHDTL